MKRIPGARQARRHDASAGRTGGEALALELGALLAADGEPDAIERVRLRPSAYRSTHPLEEASLRLTGGRTLELVLKGCGREPTPEAPGPRPRFVADPRREPWAYERILGPLAVGAPRFYGILEPTPARGSRLVLERVEGTPLGETGDLSAWTATARWLAAFHRAGASFAADPGRAVRQGPALHRLWLRRARRQAAERGRRRARAILDGVGDAYERAVTTLARSPSTLLHGELYASNVLVTPDGGEWAVRPLDWETIGVGPALLDLAALVSGRWDDVRRGAIVDAYRRASPGRDESDAEFARRLACARLVTAVQWLGWAPGWSPPPAHDHDWLSEVARASEAVGR